MINNAKYLYLVSVCRLSEIPGLDFHMKNQRSKEEKNSQEKTLSRRQRPSTINQLGSRHIRTSDTQRYNLSSNQSPNEPFCPDALPPRSETLRKRRWGAKVNWRMRSEFLCRRGRCGGETALVVLVKRILSAIVLYEDWLDLGRRHLFRDYLNNFNRKYTGRLS